MAMQPSIADQISTVFDSLGIHPLLGTFLCGIFLGWLLFRRTSAQTQNPTFSAATLGAGSKVITQSQMIRFNSNVPDGELVVNNTKIDLPPEKVAHIVQLAQDGKLIEAIKEIRQFSGLDLKSAKDVVELMAKGKQ